MKPNEMFGAQIIFVIGALVCFIVGAIAYDRGVNDGYYNKLPITGRASYNKDYSNSIKNEIDSLLDDDFLIDDTCLIDSKIKTGGIKNGNKYSNSCSKPEELSKYSRRNEEESMSSTESDKRSKQKFKENIWYLGRFFQNSWRSSIALVGIYHLYGN